MTWRGYTITQPFGVKNTAYRLGYHPGTDFRFSLGSHQPAFADGVAHYQKDNGGGYGNTGTISLPNGDKIFHAHLKANGILVAQGSKVTNGQMVFVTGDTGWIEGVHAHVEYRIGGSQNNVVDITKKLGEQMISSNFVKDMYHAISGRTPSSGEVTFHTTKSTAHGLLRGFIDNGDLAWKKKDAQIKNLNSAIAEKDKLLAKIKKEAESAQGERKGELEAHNQKILEITAKYEQAKEDLEQAKKVDEKAVVEGWFKRLWNRLFN